MRSSSKTEQERRKSLRCAGWRAEQAGPFAVGIGTEHSERHGAARDGQQAIAGAVKYGESDRRRRPDDGKDTAPIGCSKAATRADISG